MHAIQWRVAVATALAVLGPSRVTAQTGRFPVATFSAWATDTPVERLPRFALTGCLTTLSLHGLTGGDAGYAAGMSLRHEGDTLTVRVARFSVSQLHPRMLTHLPWKMVIGGLVIDRPYYLQLFLEDEREPALARWVRTNWGEEACRPEAEARPGGMKNF